MSRDLLLALPAGSVTLNGRVRRSGSPPKTGSKKSIMGNWSVPSVIMKTPMDDGGENSGVKSSGPPSGFCVSTRRFEPGVRPGEGRTESNVAGDQVYFFRVY